MREDKSINKHISISADMTVKERENLRKVVAEKRQRENEGDYSWTIYRGELVKKRFRANY